MFKKFFLSATGLLLASTAYAQTSGWEKPITDYATSVLSGVQSTISIIGVVVVIVLLGWGFFAKKPDMYIWALGGVIIIILAQLAPGLISSLTSVS